ncbi:MAG: hypothetical protein K9I85_11630 [Saprospiraceae bacterium]|nr:hypothetical protein [Saprospiraceae bacterium]
MNRTFVPKKADDSHTNLFFDPISHRLYGRWIHVENKSLIFSLNLKAFQYEWLNDQHHVLHAFLIDGLTITDLERSIEAILPLLGLQPSGFRDDLHFKIPDYSFRQEAISHLPRAALTQWERNRTLANQACHLMVDHLQVPAEVRIWPHHFDTGVYLEANPYVGLGFGFAMEDSMVGQPYFYYSGYGLNDHTIPYHQIKDLEVGKWIVEDHWKGAVLPLSDVAEEGLRKMNAFIREVSHWYLR